MSISFESELHEKIHAVKLSPENLTLYLPFSRVANGPDKVPPWFIWILLSPFNSQLSFHESSVLR